MRSMLHVAGELCVLGIAAMTVPGDARAQDAPRGSAAHELATAPQQATASSDTPIRDEAPVVVTGALPGPGMWKVSRGGHTMYVLGTVSPLPKGFDWIARDVEKALAQSTEVLVGTGVRIDADVGLFGKLALLPSLIGVRKNPDKARLRDLVPAEAYARWQVLKQRYIGRDHDVEEWRPVYAALKLYEEAIEDRGLTGRRVVSPVIDAAVKRHGIRRTEPQLKIDIADPKAVIREFRAERLSDVACFDKTMRNLEADLERMTQRANAWAVGDIEALQALPLGDQYQACRDAFLHAAVARKRGLENVEARARETWLVAAETAMARNAVSFAVLPLSELLKPDGYLDALQARGYTVLAPGAEQTGQAPGTDATP